MMGREIRLLSLYRLRTTWRGHLGGYLTIVVLVAAIGGLALASVAAARRTQSSYPVLVASTHPSDIEVATAVDNPAIGNGQGYNPALVAEIARLPHVRSVAEATGINMAPLSANGTPIGNSYLPVSAGDGSGSLGGEFFGTDRFVITEGRAPAESSTDAFMTEPQTAAAFGWHLGQVVRIGVYSDAQTKSPAFGTPSLPPHRVLDLRLVGLGEPVTDFIADDVDFTSGLGWFSPALTRELLGCCVNYTVTDVVVDAPGDVGSVRHAIAAAAPRGVPVSFLTPPSSSIGKAERAMRPISIALGAFGGIAGLALLLVVSQVLGRQLRMETDDRGVLRALGASPAMTSADALCGIVASILAGALLAALLAVALSPLAPLGPVRAVYPERGVSFDWTVLGLGVVGICVTLCAVAVVLAHLNSPQRLAALGGGETGRPSLASRLAPALQLPVAVATGIRFALEPGSGRRAVPVRSAILGGALATVVLIATVTFGASIDHLVSTPALYGWNWDYALSAGGGGGGGDIPPAQAVHLLGRDPYVARYSAVDEPGYLTIDGQAVATMAERPGAAVQPPTLQGTGLVGNDQIVLGARTLAALHKHIGDVVSVATGLPGHPARRLRIVGVATMPTMGSTGGLHLEMGSGALVPIAMIPQVLENPFGDPQVGPAAYLIDLKAGSDPVAARRSLQAMTGPLSNTYNFGVVLQSVLRPAEIVNYRSVGATPAALGAGLGAGAITALGLTLLAAVRRRSRDLALLKTLGFTRRQLAATVAWQSNAAVLVGTAAGVPLGIITGNWLWDLFARQINVVPVPEAPALAIGLIALGALVLANMVSLLPGRIAAGTSTAILLRAE